MNIYSTMFVLAIMAAIGLIGYANVQKEQNKYEVLKEVAQMKLQGQNEQEIVMNVKSTTDLKEVRAALKALEITK